MVSTIIIGMLMMVKKMALVRLLDWLFMLLPQYCIGSGIIDIFINYKLVTLCSKLNLDEYMLTFVCQTKRNFNETFPCCRGNKDVVSLSIK